MGNAVGNLEEYWQTIENSKRLIGGCIWDWVDQGLAAKVPGTEDEYFFAYGGDFGDYPNDLNFCMNGITTPDRQITPKMLEMKKVYEFIDVLDKNAKAGTVVIKNKYHFLNTNQFVARWELLKSGEVVESGSLGKLNVEAGTEREVRVPFQSKLESTDEYFINIYFELDKDELWAKRGWVMAKEQLLVSAKSQTEEYIPILPDLNVTDDKNFVNVVGKNFNMKVSKKFGVITDLEYFNTTVLKTKPDALGLGLKKKILIHNPDVDHGFIAGPKVNIFRARLDNDHQFGGGPGPKWIKEKLYNMTDTVRDFSFETVKGNVVIKTTHHTFSETGYFINTEVVYTVHKDGKIDVKANFDPKATKMQLAKLGFLMNTPKGFENIKWYGRGPHEAYRDRFTSALVGKYALTVDEMLEDYVRPQDMANRTGIRWFTVANRDGYGMKISSDKLFNFSALHYTPYDLEKANHPFELERRDETILTVDLQHHGLGGGSCGPGAMKQHTLKAEKATFNFSIESYRYSE
jgi:beta-galactosidase